jgi:hypothetical protein
MHADTWCYGICAGVNISVDNISNLMTGMCRGSNRHCTQEWMASPPNTAMGLNMGAQHSTPHHAATLAVLTC